MGSLLHYKKFNQEILQAKEVVVVESPKELLSSCKEYLKRLILKVLDSKWMTLLVN